MANLLSCLKADEVDKFVGHESDAEEDEDVSTIVGRRQSMNQFNQLGMNFQKYQDIKPSAGVRREILNMFNEYKELEDKKHAMEEFQSICEQYDIQKFQFVGYFLSNSLAEKPQDFRQYIGLVFDCFYSEAKLLDNEQMRESINVCVACLPDLIIDYPNAKNYANEIFADAVKHGIMTEEEEGKYKTHIDNLEAYI